MSQVIDVNQVIDAFLLLDYTFSTENFENSFMEKYEAMPKLRKIIEQNIRLFAECIPNEDTKPHTVFIIYADNEDYENQQRKKFYRFITCDEEVLSVINKNFSVFNNDGEATISHYGFNAPMQEIANYIIAQSSLNKFGKEICIANILSELFFWGAFPEEREKTVNELYEIVSKPIDEKELLDIKTFEKEIKKYKEQLISDMSDDEKAYHLAKERFKEDTEDIIKRYRHRVMNELHKQWIAVIKEEYKKR